MEICTGISANVERFRCIFAYALCDERACAFANGYLQPSLASASEHYKMVATDHFPFPDVPHCEEVTMATTNSLEL